MSAKKKKFPLLPLLGVLVAVILVAVILFFRFNNQSSLTRTPVGINLVGNGMTPEVAEGPATIFGRIGKSTAAGTPGTFFIISRSSGALYELEVEGLDDLIGTNALVEGIVIPADVPQDAPILKVESITPDQG